VIAVIVLGAVGVAVVVVALAVWSACEQRRLP
jgi:hypothetical protein